MLMDNVRGNQIGTIQVLKTERNVSLTGIDTFKLPLLELIFAQEKKQIVNFKL